MALDRKALFRSVGALPERAFFMRICFSYHLLLFYCIPDSLYKEWFSCGIYNSPSHMEQLFKEQEYSHGKGKAGCFYLAVYALLSVVQFDMSVLMENNLHALNGVSVFVVGNYAALFPCNRMRK